MLMYIAVWPGDDERGKSPSSTGDIGELRVLLADVERTGGAGFRKGDKRCSTAKWAGMRLMLLRNFAMTYIAGLHTPVVVEDDY
jgi:hypothetical protein